MYIFFPCHHTLSFSYNKIAHIHAHTKCYLLNPIVESTFAESELCVNLTLTELKGLNLSQMTQKRTSLTRVKVVTLPKNLKIKLFCAFWAILRLPVDLNQLTQEAEIQDPNWILICPRVSSLPAYNNKASLWTAKPFPHMIVYNHKWLSNEQYAHMCVPTQSTMHSH